MRVAVVGGGPGGLFTALMLKRRGVAGDVVLWERDRAHTAGFGVILPPGTPELIRQAAPELASAMARSLVHWESTTVRRGGESWTTSATPDMSAIARSSMNKLLWDACETEGVTPARARGSGASGAVLGLRPRGLRRRCRLPGRRRRVSHHASGGRPAVRLARLGPRRRRADLSRRAGGRRALRGARVSVHRRGQHLPRRGPAGARRRRGRAGSSAFALGRARRRARTSGAGFASGRCGRGRGRTSCSSATPRTPCTTRSGTAPAWRWRTPRRWSTASPTATRVAPALRAYEDARRPVVEHAQEQGRLSAEWFARAGDEIELPLSRFAANLLTRGGRLTRDREPVAS